MKKKTLVWGAVLLTLAVLLAVRIARVPVDYGESELFSKGDRVLAAADVRLNFLTMFGCRLERIYYAGDERSQAEYDYYCGQLGWDYDECMVFYADFHTPRHTLSMNPDADYTGWGYILGRKNGGLWHVLTQGYG